MKELFTPTDEKSIKIEREKARQLKKNPLVAG